MKYANFVEKMKEEISICVKDDVSVYLYTTTKNNGKKRQGITVVEKGINISPTIYLEEYYQQYNQGASIAELAQNFMQVYKEVRFTHSWDGDMLSDYEWIHDKIIYKLINYDKNQELLKQVPHEKFLDLAMVCHVLLELYDNGTATMVIKHQNLVQWDVPWDKIREAALQNARNMLPYYFKPMSEVLNEMVSDIFLEEEAREEISTVEPIYVLSNTIKHYGASVILYEGVLEQIEEELGENYYVIPSSVHEVIIVPESQCSDRTILEQMIGEINATEVAEEELLSSRPYYYSKKAGRLLY